jgi:hypothetical protein
LKSQISNPPARWRGRLARSLIACIAAPTLGCAYRESSNGDSYHSRILLTEASPVFAADGTLNRVSLDKNFNPNVPNP